jgi:transposase-like protein
LFVQIPNLPQKRCAFACGPPPPQAFLFGEVSSMARKCKKKLLSQKQLRAIEMLINPEVSYTKEEIASCIGINSATLYRWLQDARFLEVLNQKAEELLGASKYRVLRALLKKIDEGDVQAMKLYFEKIGEIQKLSALKVTVDLGGLNDVPDKAAGQAETT